MSAEGQAPPDRQQRRNVTVDGERAGQRLDNFLLACLRGLPRSRVYRMVRRGEVRVNGARATPARRLEAGDVVRIPPHRRAPAATPAEAPPRALFEALLAGAVHEDDDMVVLDKPSGIAVHGGSGVSFGVVELLRRYDPGTAYELAHRLDRDTSGCLAVAKNRGALLRLHAQFREGRVGKRYDLLVAGVWPARLRRVEHRLQRYALPNGERRVRVSAAGDFARTDFEVVAQLPGEYPATWLRAFPKTGRTHQIRVHAAAQGHPILGDDKYGRDALAGAGRLMLHASELRLRAKSGDTRLVAPLPGRFAALGAVSRRAD